MAGEESYLIYLIFFLIPLARILPRLVRKWQKRDNKFSENQVNQINPRIEQRQEAFERPKERESFERPLEREAFERPKNKEMLVLGKLNKGFNNFNKIQKDIGMNPQELEDILKDLEDQGLMKVVKKGGLVGTKIELYSTDKGYKRYHS